jgi:hypothetical protein
VHLAGGPLARPCRIRSRSGVLRIALREGCRELFGDCRFELDSLGMFDTWLVDLGLEAGRLAGRQDSGEQEAGSRGRARGRGRGRTGGRQAGRQAGKSAGRAAGRLGSSAASCILRRHPSVTVEESKAKRGAPHDTHASASRRIPTKTDESTTPRPLDALSPRHREFLRSAHPGALPSLPTWHPLAPSHRYCTGHARRRTDRIAAHKYHAQNLGQPISSWPLA